MGGQCGLSYALGWLSYWGYIFIPLLVILIIARFLNRKNFKKYDEYYNKSWANQEEMIALLKEIRDLIKAQPK